MRALLTMVFVAGSLGCRPLAAQQHHTYVLVHGAWGGGWDWRAVDSMLTLRGNRVVRVTLTGQGERAHLGSPSIGLGTHIADVVNTILWEDLHDVVLVGHSYGGMIVTGVVDRIPGRIRRVVYLDAFLPDSGESALVPGWTPRTQGYARWGVFCATGGLPLCRVLAYCLFCGFVIL